MDEHAVAEALEHILTEQCPPERPASRPVRAESTDGIARQESAGSKLQRLATVWRGDGAVRGFGVGEKMAGNRSLVDLAIRIYVNEKLPKHGLEFPVPPYVELPGLGEVPTDVVEVGRVRAQLGRERHRPFMPGVSIGHERQKTGTLGCFVRRRNDDGKRYILSNAHVLAECGCAVAGDRILQPGIDDGGTLDSDVIARLTETTYIDFTSLNEIDAAIAEVVDPTYIDPMVRELDLAPQGRLVRTPKRGQMVIKVGRSTNYSIAEIRDVNASIRVEYETSQGVRTALFHNQILCTKFTEAGDSGALVMTRSGRPVGLHFAGSEKVSISNKIGKVFDTFGLVL